MINTGLLLECPECRYTPKPQTLGRLYPDGSFLVLRFHSGTSMIKANDFSVACGCGFSFLIRGTAIVGTVKIEV